MSENISKGKGKKEIERICDECGKAIEKDDVWYPFFDISTHGGGILYLHARCTVERIVNAEKEDILERATQAERGKNAPLSDGLMNFYWVFPISPIHWVKFYAMDHDFEEIKRLIKEVEKQNKGKSGR